MKSLFDLSSESRDAVAELLRQEGIDFSGSQSIRRREIRDHAALSYAQRRLWFLYEFEADKALYNIPTALRLKGRLQVGALEQAIGEIVRRHEALRTRIAELDGDAVQVIEEGVELGMPVVDLEKLLPGEREQELDRRVKEEAERAFDLRRSPLLRALLLRLNEQEHVLVLTMHHIASDGWSLGIVARELGVLYEAYSQGKESPLEELPIQYADYAVWQREWLRGEVEQNQLQYWRKKLAELPASLELPGVSGTQTRPANSEGSAYWFNLAPDLLGELRDLSSRHGVTLYMTLLAGFQVLLHRYSGEHDIVVANPIAGRTRSETEGLIGFFVNTLLLRTDLSGNPSFVELLERVRATTLGAYENQDVPYERIVEELQPDRGVSGTPLAQVMFDLRKGGFDEWPMGSVLGIAREIYFGRAKFDLYLHFSETGDTLTGNLEYRKSAISAESVERMAGHLEQLLRQIVAYPESRIGELQLLTATERQHLLIECNQTLVPYENDRCIHELFEAQVQRSPEAPAVRYGGQELTYRQLNEKSNQLAHHLKKLGVAPEVLVGLCVERSLEMVIGILGILKAGGAYLPLDPQQPAERLRHMLQDSGAALLLTQERWQQVCAPQSGPVICLDSYWPTIAAENSANLDSQTVPENLAYVMYTSGSTGVPKGSSIQHGSVVRLVRHVNYAELGSQEVILQFAPVSFDGSTFEIWGSLLNGGRLEIIDAGTPSFEALGQAIQERNVSTIWLTSGLFHQMVEHQNDALKGLRQLLAGGDVLSPGDVKKFLEDNSEGCLINGYGPTENTTFTCCHTMRRGFEGSTVPIGRPISNTQVFVLDRYGQPVPVGVVGELYTGGIGLARGYANRADLTAEKFVPNPFSEKGGERLYRTGDLVRYREDGVLEFIGRNDRQVKIRGFRIELGEIEAVLQQHEGVREAAVIVRQGVRQDARRDQPAEKMLAAYVVTEGIGIPELRAYLRQRLPEYMIPAYLLVVEQMPLTPSGKLDRKALPAPEFTTQSGRAPRTAEEEFVAALFAAILGIEQIGIDDNFFQKGGHSLLAMRLISRLRTVLLLDVPVRVLFENPAVAEFTSAIMAFESRTGQTQKIIKILQQAQATHPK